MLKCLLKSMLLVILLGGDDSELLVHAQQRI